MAESIRKRYKKGCPARGGGRCRCDRGYEASVFSPRDGKKFYKTFAREPEARSWRAATKRALDRGSLRAGNGKTLEDAATAWLEGASRGEIRSRSGRPYKPATLCGYTQALVNQLLPRLGTRRLSAITTLDLQELVDAWQVEGHAPSTIRKLAEAVAGHLPPGAHAGRTPDQPDA